MKAESHFRDVAGHGLDYTRGHATTPSLSSGRAQLGGESIDAPRARQPDGRRAEKRRNDAETRLLAA